MSALIFSVEAFLIAMGAGVLGSLLGIGGGIVIVPALTLFLGVDIRFAIGASIVSVIATSSGAAVAYVKAELANIRLAMLLEVATVAGALGGAFAGGYLPRQHLYLLFGLLLFFVALMMIRGRAREGREVLSAPKPTGSDRFELSASYDDFHRAKIFYSVRNIALGLQASLGAGVMSGLLGVGGGVVKVPVMNLVMGVPLKVATATSNLMIGVTAAASALVYFVRGDINPFIAAPVALGVLLGAQLGSRLMSRVESRFIQQLFVVVLMGVAGQMCWKWWSALNG